MEKSIANAISIVFHPVFITLYAFIVFLFYNDFMSSTLPLNEKVLILTLVLLTCVLLPGILMVIYKRMGWIISYHMKTKEERRLPLITTGLVLLTTALMFQHLDTSTILYLFLLAGTILNVVLMLITNFWKISLHTSAISGLLGALCGLSINGGFYLYPLILIATFVAGLVGFARLKLNCHSPLQIYAGYVIGFVVVFSLFVYL